MSFDVILPFLRPIAHLIADQEVSEIMVNGSRSVFVERDGVLQEVADVRLDERNLRVAVKNIARALGDDVSEEKPILDSRLPDGSRVAAVFPPCSVGGTTLTIRKFQTRFFTAEELVRIGTMTTEVLSALCRAIAAGQNVLISGGTSTGKTTVLNALARFLPASDRIVIVEDTAELHVEHANLVRFEARRDQQGVPAITIRDLLRATLRHRPDRIIVGEVRGGEAFDLPLSVEHRACWHAVDHSRQFRVAGACATGGVCASRWRRLAVSSGAAADRRRDSSRAAS
jgi:pilus assembly protein CpaF